MEQQLQAFEGKVRTLDDKDLVEQLRQLFNREKKISDAILLGLKEIKQRSLFAAMGFSSLFEMLVKHYHLSETASYQRVNALKLIESVPDAQEALFSGEVSLSNAALVQSFIHRSEKEAKSTMSIEEKMTIIESIKGKTHREAQVTLAEVNPIAALPANKEKPLSKSHTQLQIVVDEETLALLKEIQALLSHTIPDGDYNAVLNYMGKQVIEPLRKKKGCSTPALDSKSKSVFTSTSTSAFASAPESILSSTPESELQSQSLSNRSNTDASKHCVGSFDILPENKTKVCSRYISQKTKRIVYARSKGQCEFRGINGNRCSSRHQLEFDHIIPWSQTGTNDEDNIRILCRTHNLYRTKATHGFWYQKHKPGQLNSLSDETAQNPIRTALFYSKSTGMS
ncbi:MAG: HNH endonuclease [Bdellovibrio sp.]